MSRALRRGISTPSHTCGLQLSQRQLIMCRTILSTSMGRGGSVGQPDSGITAQSCFGLADVMMHCCSKLSRGLSVHIVIQSHACMKTWTGAQVPMSMRETASAGVGPEDSPEDKASCSPQYYLPG